MLVCLGKGERFAGLAVGFGVSATTVWRYVEETVRLSAARVPELHAVLCGARAVGHACLILDGALIPIVGVAPGRSFHSGKHRKHGTNPQVITASAGVGWVSGPLPGSVHDIKTARIWCVLRQLQAAGLPGPAPQGALRGRRAAEALARTATSPPLHKKADRAHARPRSQREHPTAQPKPWHLLRKLRCCSHKAGLLTNTNHVPQDHEIQATAARKTLTDTGAESLLRRRDARGDAGHRYCLHARVHGSDPARRLRQCPGLAETG
ncbi:IS5/IS1182 family transposase [Spirillospora sp. CA-253888]